MRELVTKIHERISGEISSKFCGECSGTCCDTQKHSILIDENSLSLFQKKGIPIIRKNRLNRNSIRDYKETIKSKLLLKNGSEVQRPSLVQLKSFPPEVYLYADICPFYQQDKSCEIHEDSRRPRDCKQYPLSFRGYEKPKEIRLDVKIMESCKHVEDVKSFLQSHENPSIRIID